MKISWKTMEVATAATTGLIGAIVCYGSLENGIAWGSSGPQPGYFPFGIGCLIMLGSLGTMVQALLKRSAAPVVASAGGGEVHDDEPFMDTQRFRTVLLFFLPIIAMSAISVWLGLYIGMALYIFYAMRFAAGFRTSTSVLTAVIVVAANFIVFEKLFMVPLLKGPILEYFGIY
ncbi:tripartite tricarboxylate transporter TctB family protein [Roseixanthobacter pseudopolyaromaticivorans]|uniref:tripartite tricarboxylate transporter TctB family protein n=1 Tax=Xanthobacteraceae TaxID=335928 RepID=UPI00372BC9EF